MGALTVQQICVEAMRELNVAAAGEPPDSEDVASVQLRFNMMIDAWKAERLMIFQTLRKLYDTVANQQQYAIGPTGDWVVSTRPLAIARAGFVNTATDATQPLETPIHCYTDEEWASIVLKNFTSSIDWGLWYETSYSDNASSKPGNGNIFMYPVPSVVAKIALYLPVPIDEVADDETGLAVTIYTPPGYRAAMVSYLAVDSADLFKIAVSPTLLAKAARAMKRVRRSNTKPATLVVPKALIMSRGRRGYNILTNN